MCNRDCPAECHINICLDFEIAYFAGTVLEVCLELSQAVWSNSNGSQLELIGIEYYSSPIQGKHNVCQDEGWRKISEDVCKKYILAKWQFVGATGKIIDHVHFPISRRGGFLNDLSFQYRQRSFSSGHMTTDIAWWVKRLVYHISCCFGFYYLKLTKMLTCYMHLTSALYFGKH